MRSLFPKQGPARGRGSHQRAAVQEELLHERGFGCFLPDGEPWAGCPPRIYRFLVRAFLPTYPFHEIEEQILNGIGHRRYRGPTTLRFDCRRNARTLELHVPLAPSGGEPPGGGRGAPFLPAATAVRRRLTGDPAPGRSA
jgi:hypothetical protein